jgi:hypothetical protein
MISLLFDPAKFAIASAKHFNVLEIGIVLIKEIFFFIVE